MTLESIERLRELRDETASKMVDNPRWVCARAEEIADEVEREIAERFMEQPEGWTNEQASEVLGLWPRWDDGSPCMFGDEFTCYPKYDMERKYKVFDRLTIYWKYHVWNRGEDKEKPHDGGFYEWNYMRPGGDGCEEYRPTKRKPRTVEDVLRDCCNEWNEHCGDDWESGVYAKYADELRELLGGDGE